MRKILKPGTIIRYCNTEAEVFNDDGGAEIHVKCDGYVSVWRWEFDGILCEVVKEPGIELGIEGQKLQNWLKSEKELRGITLSLTDNGNKTNEEIEEVFREINEILSAPIIEDKEFF